VPVVRGGGRAIVERAIDAMAEKVEASGCAASIVSTRRAG
jgi:hypothetical protein